MTKIVTPGGEFSQDMRIIKKLKSIVNFFGSGQQQLLLDNVVNTFHLPTCRLKNYADTRVAYCSDLFKSCIVNYFAFQQLSLSCEEFKKLFEMLNDEEWKGVQEMESICNQLATYALSDVQNDTSSISMRLYYRMVCLKESEKSEFNVLLLGRQQKIKTIHTCP